MEGFHPNEEHVDENMLLDLAEGLASAQTVRWVHQHVDSCEACWRLFVDIARVTETAAEPAAAELDTADEEDEETKPRGKGGQLLLAGRFALVRRLGRGATGLVYEAYDTRLEVPVALKLLAPEVLSHGVFVHALEKEIRLGRRVTHPNVCRVYDVTSSGGCHFISMELIEGETLEQLMQRGQPSQAVALRILDQVCRALEAAHAQGVVHRDLKPSNVMVRRDGSVAVMDFGLAVDLQEAPSLRMGPVGTPGYWAPEQSLGERATASSDIYSFGVLAFRLFTGLGAARHTEPGALAAVPPPYRRVVGKCLRPAASDRYSDVGALREDLTRRETPARPRRLGMALGTVVIASVGAAVVLFRPGMQSDAATEPAGRPEQPDGVERRSQTSPPNRPAKPPPELAEPQVHGSSRDSRDDAGEASRASQKTARLPNSVRGQPAASKQTVTSRPPEGAKVVGSSAAPARTNAPAVPILGAASPRSKPPDEAAPPRSGPPDKTAVPTGQSEAEDAPIPIPVFD